MTRVSRVVFGLLVAASFGAFFAAQQLKSSPSVVQLFQLGWPVFSPNGDGRKDLQRIHFRLKRADTVDVAVLDTGGDVVKELGTGIALARYRTTAPGTLTWDGTTSAGKPASDGTYRVRITLRHEGRSVVMQRAFGVDRTPPAPRVLSIGPTRERHKGPELLPHANGAPARIRFSAPAHSGRLLIFRTAPGPVRRVRAITIPEAATTMRWSGIAHDGRPAAAGTYLAVLEVRDIAGNIGTSVPLGPGGLPVVAYGLRAPGNGGMEIRDLAVQPPLGPVKPGARVALAVDARGKPYTWSARRIGAAVSRRGSKRGPFVNLKVPSRSAGLFLFTARRAGHEASAPFLVSAPVRRPVLVVAPLMTWQGRNALDDDGDGFPNVLARGQRSRLARVLATPLPQGFAAHEAPLFSWLDRAGHLYDATTDAALALSAGPGLAGHRGVLLAGDTVWLPAPLQRRLLRFVRAGGTLVSMGTGSLRSTVRLTQHLRMDRPTPAAKTDLFGSELAPLRRLAKPVDLTNSNDRAGLFSGTEGLFHGFSLIEELRSPGTSPLTATAVTPDGSIAIEALKVGRGRVVRFGLPQLAARLGTDVDVQALMERTWQLLSR